MAGEEKIEFPLHSLLKDAQEWHGADLANPVASVVVYDNSQGTGCLPRSEIG
jgi:hypothetical protein